MKDQTIPELVKELADATCCMCGSEGSLAKCPVCGAYVCATCFMGRVEDNRCPECDSQTMY